MKVIRANTEPFHIAVGLHLLNCSKTPCFRSVRQPRKGSWGQEPVSILIEKSVCHFVTSHTMAALPTPHPAPDWHSQDCFMGIGMS